MPSTITWLRPVKSKPYFVAPFGVVTTTSPLPWRLNVIGAEDVPERGGAIDRHTVLVGGYSHFFAGSFLDDVSPTMAEDTDWFWAQWVYTF